MKSSEIRASFLEHFQSRSHRIVSWGLSKKRQRELGLAQPVS